MKIRISLLVCALSFWVVSPARAQHGNGNGDGSGKGHGHGHGHTDKGGPNENGSDKGGPDENGSDKGDRHEQESRLLATISELVTALSTGTLTTASGAVIPVSAQAKVYAVLTRNGATLHGEQQVATTGADARATILHALAYNIDRLSAPLANSGQDAAGTIPPLVRSMWGLADNLDWLPTVVTNYNKFVQSASPWFLADPPPEFVAVHTVLARLTAAAAGK